MKAIRKAIVKRTAMYSVIDDRRLRGRKMYGRNCPRRIRVIPLRRYFRRGQHYPTKRRNKRYREEKI